MLLAQEFLVSVVARVAPHLNNDAEQSFIKRIKL